MNRLINNFWKKLNLNFILLRSWHLKKYTKNKLIMATRKYDGNFYKIFKINLKNFILILMKKWIWKKIIWYFEFKSQTTSMIEVVNNKKFLLLDRVYHWLKFFKLNFWIVFALIRRIFRWIIWFYSRNSWYWPVSNKKSKLHTLVT